MWLYAKFVWVSTVTIAVRAQSAVLPFQTLAESRACLDMRKDMFMNGMMIQWKGNLGRKDHKGQRGRVFRVSDLES